MVRQDFQNPFPGHSSVVARVTAQHFKNQFVLAETTGIFHPDLHRFFRKVLEGHVLQVVQPHERTGRPGSLRTPALTPAFGPAPLRHPTGIVIITVTSAPTAKAASIASSSSTPSPPEKALPAAVVIAGTVVSTTRPIVLVTLLFWSFAIHDFYSSGAGPPLRGGFRLTPPGADQLFRLVP